MGERTTWAKHRCPLCSRRTALVCGKLSRHKHEGKWCEASGITTYEATLVLARRLALRACPAPTPMVTAAAAGSPGPAKP